MILNLITDRTEADRDRALEIVKKLNAGTATDTEREDLLFGRLKGTYDYTDFNRVTAAMDAIKASLEEDGYLVDGYQEMHKEWSDSDAPRTEQLNAYLANVAAIRATLDVLSTTPETPADMDLLTWMEANDIEQILVDVETVAQSMRKVYRRSNQVALYSGFGLWFTVADEESVLPDIYVSGEALSLAANASVSDNNLVLAVGYTVGETLVL